MRQWRIWIVVAALMVAPDLGWAGGSPEAAGYVCPMHPSVRSVVAGSCPKCSMPLEQVAPAAPPQKPAAMAEVTVEPGRAQAIGIRTHKVERRPWSVTVRAPARITFDAARLSEVSIRYPAWVGRLYVTQVGQQVAKGDRLFDLYSYELYMAQRELLSARELERRGGISQVDEARRRLRRLGVADKQIALLEKDAVELEFVPIHAASSGVVVEHTLVVGSGIGAGDGVIRLADLDQVWIEADVAVADLADVQPGMAAEVWLPGDETGPQPAEVALVVPFVAPGSPTGVVRLVAGNAARKLRPGTFADVTLTIDRGLPLVAPADAVVYGGPRRLVFVQAEPGRYVAREVTVGRRSGGEIEVLSGVEPGELVVTQGAFLIAAESRLRSATGAW